MPYFLIKEDFRSIPTIWFHTKKPFIKLLIAFLNQKTAENNGTVIKKHYKDMIR